MTFHSSNEPSLSGANPGSGDNEASSSAKNTPDHASQRKLSRRTVLLGLGLLGAAAAGGGALWWLHQSQRPRPLTLLSQGAVFSVAWSPDGRRIAAASGDGKVHIWDASTGKTLLTYRGHSGEVFQAAWSSDGTRIASFAPLDGVHIWEAATGKALTTFGEGNAQAFSQCLAWAPDGTRLIYINEGKLQLYDAESGTLLFNAYDVADSPSTVAWAPDSTRFASAGGGLAQVWAATPAKTPLLSYSITTGDDPTIFALAWSYDSTHIVTGSFSGVVNVWEAATGKTLLTSHSGNSTLSAAWSPDGAQIGISTLGTIQIVDARSGKQITRYTGDYAVSWSPDGKRLAFANLGLVEVIQPG
jgi:WD40 repeat protein